MLGIYIDWLQSIASLGMDPKWELPGIPLRNPRQSNPTNEAVSTVPLAKQSSHSFADIPIVQQGYARNQRYRPGVQHMMAKGSSINSQISNELPPIVGNAGPKNRGMFNPVAFNMAAAGFNGTQGHKWVGGGGRYAFTRR